MAARISGEGSQLAIRRASHNAAKTYDLFTATFGGTFEATDLLVATIGTKSVSFVAGSVTTTTVISNFVTAWNALDSAIYPEFAEYTAAVGSSTTATLTADKPGIPGEIALVSTEANGDPQDSQTLSIAHTTTATGPWTWDNAANWLENAVPTTGDDVYLANSSIPFRYGFAQTAVTLASLHIAASHSGDVALPLQNENGYREYRANYLAIKATICNIGYGDGRGARRIWLDLSTAQTALSIYGSGPPIDDGLEAILIKGTHADNTLTATQGSIGVGVLSAEVATFKTNKIGNEGSPDQDVKLRFGPGCTLNGAGSTFLQEGGTVITESSLLAVTKNSGTLILRGAAAVSGTLANRGGKLIDESTGTLTALDNSGDYDRSRFPKPKTITDATARKGCRIYDPLGTITWTNPVQFNQCSLEECPGTDFGKHRKLTVADI